MGSFIKNCKLPISLLFYFFIRIRFGILLPPFSLMPLLYHLYFYVLFYLRFCFISF
ncbi:hypothetical protein BRYFOR_05317 [Marvinbryantia formatexigens DSM 14469]|uniref:Uncharacterized protein n=1 Tax=Marvinbryantia formatexigens DSM 14469 TaxID=478749 RepID=C6L9M7_9FIRM|nr:hypothetical protein BRYFOR_05317 [Marvinbryantia formatexigens DSM 14469]